MGYKLWYRRKEYQPPMRVIRRIDVDLFGLFPLSARLRLPSGKMSIYITRVFYAVKNPFSGNINYFRRLGVR